MIAGEYPLRCSSEPLTGVQLLDPVASKFQANNFPWPEHIANWTVCCIEQ